MDEKELEIASPVLPAAPDLKKAKKDFSRVGFALFAFFAVIAVLQYAAGLLLSRPGMPDSAVVQWLVSYIIPLYVIGVPVAVLVMRGVPAERVEPQRLGAGKFFLFLLMCFPVMYGGNLIGTILSSMFSGGSAENPLMNVVMENSWIQVVVLVVLAPLFEEFIFRKQLIDRLSRYGEKTAIFFSGLTFGLFHGNLYQFFYAFGLGLIFAYIYTRTRRLRYSAVMHMCINFLGSVLAPWILKQVDLDSLDALAQGAVDVDFGGIGLLFLYAVLLLGLSIAGLVLLIRHRKKFLILPTAEELPKGTRFKTSCLNAGVILFALVCIGMFVASLFL